ncbi:MAG TPA: hypothetical protein VF681_11145 [Abditibacteriaceae bacterium]|jgi:transposase-like protein
MKKLTDDERLERGVQILLTAQDKADLEKMAQLDGLSLSAAARPHVLKALEKWRKQNPEAAAAEPPAKPKTLTLNGKAVRSERSLETYLKAAEKSASNNGSNENGTANKGATSSAKIKSGPSRPAAKKAAPNKRTGQRGVARSTR